MDVVLRMATRAKGTSCAWRLFHAFHRFTSIAAANESCGNTYSKAKSCRRLQILFRAEDRFGTKHLASGGDSVSLSIVDLVVFHYTEAGKARALWH